MEFRTIDDIIETIKSKKRRKTCAIVGADSRYTLEAVLRAYNDGIIDPFLIGNESNIENCLQKIGGHDLPFRIIPTRSQNESAQKAADLARSGEVDILMKGNMESSVLFGRLLDKKKGLQPKKILAGLSIFEIPNYHKLLAMTDGGITIRPTLEQKKWMIENAVEALIQMGIECPKVAVLAAAEIPTSKMPETMDAAALQKMNERGEIKDCIISGPISYDLAVNRESAKIKNFDSPVAGDADLLVFPDISSGNFVTKAMVFTARAKYISVAVGARLPIIFPSRASLQEDRYRSLLVASLLSRE